MTTHAKHISDWDQVRAGQHFNLTGSTANSTLVISTLFKDLDSDASKAQMSSRLLLQPTLGQLFRGETTDTTFANDIVGFLRRPGWVQRCSQLSLRSCLCLIQFARERRSAGTSSSLLQGVAISRWNPRCWGCVSFPRCSMVLFRAHHSSRPSGYQCAHRFRGKPCMALGKGPCERSPRFSSLSQI